MNNDYADRILRFLADAGASDVAVKPGGKHPRIVFQWHGKTITYVIAGSSGDTLRGHKAAISDLRHMMGLVEPVKRVGARRTRKSSRKKTMRSECPSLTALADWQGGMLAKLSPDQLSAQLDLAWLKFWRDCIAAVGGKSVLSRATA